MALNKGHIPKTGLVIMSGSKIVYQSGNPEGMSMQQAPVGKGKGVKVQTKTRASAKGTPEVVHDLFLKCAAMCNDRFWKTHFDQAALGVFHRGFSYQNNNLIHRMRSKSKPSYCEISPDPAIAMGQFKTFLQEKAGIMSEEDAESRQNDLEHNMELQASTNLNSWNAVKTMTHRNIVIGHFVNQLGQQYDLDLHERHNLINLIMLGIAAGYFDASTICMDKGVIISISGLIRDVNGVFDIDIQNLESKSRKLSKVKRSAPVARGGRAGTVNCLDDDITSGTSGGIDDGDDAASSLTGANVNFLSKWIKFIQKLVRKSTRGSASTSAPTQMAPVYGIVPTYMGANLVIDDDESDEDEPSPPSDDGFDDEDFDSHITYTGTSTPPVNIPTYQRPPGSLVKLMSHSY
jgi:hypothetical protein